MKALFVRAPHRAFTLIELLTVIGIIGILAAIIIPVVGKVRSTARNAACTSNLRQVGMASQLYAQDNQNHLPPVKLKLGSEELFWTNLLFPYTGGDEAKYAAFQAGGTALNCAAWTSDPLYSDSISHYVGGLGFSARIVDPVNGSNLSARYPGSYNTIDFPSRRGERVPDQPSRYVVAGDSQTYFIIAYGQTMDLFSGRHGQRANFVHADAHVKSYTLTEAVSAIMDPLGTGN